MMFLERYEKEVRSAIGRDLDPHLMNAVRVDIKDAARLFYSSTEKESFRFDEDFPSILCPWKEAYFEFDPPPGTNKVTAEEGETIILGVAALVLTKSGDVPHYWDRVKKSLPKIISADETPKYTTSIKFLLIGTGGITYTAAGSSFVFVSEDGTAAVKRPIFRGEDVGEDHRQQIASLCLPLFFAISLMNCKNIECKEVSSGKRKRNTRKNGRWFFEYKVLDIAGPERILRKEGGAEEYGLKKAFHICRGHFKDYRKSGLFGKHPGVYWWADTARGDKGAGIVKKDYRVLATGEN